MKKSIFITLIMAIVLLPVVAKSQSIIEKRADLLYENLSYSKAASIYESLHKKDPDNGKMIQRLAYCYIKMLNYKKALSYYADLVNLDISQSVDYYEYAQLLRIEGNMEESRNWLGKYIQLSPDDKRAVNQYNQLNELIALMDNLEKIKVNEVEGNTHFTEMCPSFYKDQLVYSSSKDSFSMIHNEFKWNSQPFLKLYVTNPNQSNLSESSNFSKKINTRVHEGPVCFSADFNTIYFTRNSTTGVINKKSPNRMNNLKIFISNLDHDVWSEPVEFTYNSDVYSVGHPALSPDNKTLYFVSDMPGGYGETDIYKSELVNNYWSTPVNLGPTINTEGREMFPYVDKTGTLYFSSDGRPGLGGLDIYAARVYDNDQYMIAYFGLPLNSKYDDFGFILNTEYSKGFFTSNRPGGAGDDDIYSFSVVAIDLLVISKGMYSGKILPDTKVYLKGDDGEIITSEITNKEGVALFSVRPGQQYQLAAENNSYASDLMPVIISRQLFGLEQKEEVLLRQNFPYLNIKVVDFESGEAIPLAIVDVVEGKYDESSMESGNGDLRLKMDLNTNYAFNITAEGYLPNSVSYTSKGITPGEYYLTVQLERLSVGKQFALKNLYYDFDKSNIRPDAEIVLNDLVMILLENPEINIEIGSHTDSRADENYNMQLSQRRSESVVAYLIGKGVSPDRLVARGFGESQLINKCADGIECSIEEHQANRRTVIEVLYQHQEQRPISSLSFF